MDSVRSSCYERSWGSGVMVTDRSKVQVFQVGVGGTGISDGAST